MDLIATDNIIAIIDSIGKFLGNFTVLKSYLGAEIDSLMIAVLPFIELADCNDAV